MKFLKVALLFSLLMMFVSVNAVRKCPPGCKNVASNFEGLDYNGDGVIEVNEDPDLFSAGDDYNGDGVIEFDEYCYANGCCDYGSSAPCH